VPAKIRRWLCVTLTAGYSFAPANSVRGFGGVKARSGAWPMSLNVVTPTAVPR
jgi:hypothetical protein